MPRFFGSPAASSAVSLSPSATVTATKAAGNPTFPTNSLVENPINVGGTYWMPYITPASDTIYLASASNRDGPWTTWGAVKTLASVTWAPTAVAIYAPFIVWDPDFNEYALFFSINHAGGTAGQIGVCYSATINGTYSDHGSALLSGGSAGAWDENGAFEPSVIKVGSTWIMAYVGNLNDGNPGGWSEKVGIATASATNGTWTKAAGNPLPWGSAGAWNAALQADPTIFYENGYYWIWTVGHITIHPTASIGTEGLWYNNVDPASISDWHEHPSNPILSPTASTWDSARCFRGGILVESGIISGTYTGGTDISTLLTYKGGNFRLNIT